MEDCTSRSIVIIIAHQDQLVDGANDNNTFRERELMEYIPNERGPWNNKVIFKKVLLVLSVAGNQGEVRMDNNLFKFY